MGCGRIPKQNFLGKFRLIWFNWVKFVYVWAKLKILHSQSLMALLKGQGVRRKYTVAPLSLLSNTFL